ncbi:MAG TPA: DUF3761 domain-containing protein [Gemmatimonadaceae bacterium]|nr:DUF3761 domain-containing protein [Gemmatimonadaceae bacterium]
MNRTIRTILGAGIAFGAFASPVLAQGKSHKPAKTEAKTVKTVQKSNGKVTKTYRKGTTTYRRTTTYRSRALCEDGTVVFRSSNTCAGHGGLASRQGTYSTTRYPSASDRARARASTNSAVVRGIGANSIRTNAIARCNDGTYWHATTRRNACYLHGGVARWY